MTNPAPVRPINYVALVETLLLGSIGALFVVKWLRGNLDYYIHPRYTILVLLCALVLFLMAGVRMRGIFQQPASRLSGVYLLLAIPLLMGILVPAAPLGADTLAGRGIDLNMASSRSDEAELFARDPSTWNLLEWRTAISIRGEEMTGTPITTMGFVYHDEQQQLGNDAFYVARYVITCCAADGVATGFPVVWADGAALPSDSWVVVTGTLGFDTIAGVSQPIIEATSVAPTDEPEMPYLFP